jgi:hypothetical protein
MSFCEGPGLEETGGFTPNDLQELWSLLQPKDSVCPVQSGDSVSPVQYSRDSVSPNSGSEGSSRAVYTDRERRLRRKESNRLSAQRSRWRKKRHHEELKDQVNRLKTENEELKNRLVSALHYCHVVRSHNEMLRSESTALYDRLSDLYIILFSMQSQ